MRSIGWLTWNARNVQVQGQTVNKLILDANDARLDLPRLHVAISRVRTSNDLRILPLRPDTKQRLESLEFPAHVQKRWEKVNIVQT